MNFSGTCNQVLIAWHIWHRANLVQPGWLGTSEGTSLSDEARRHIGRRVAADTAERMVSFHFPDAPTVGTQPSDVRLMVAEDQHMRRHHDHLLGAVLEVDEHTILDALQGSIQVDHTEVGWLAAGEVEHIGMGALLLADKVEEVPSLAVGAERDLMMMGKVLGKLGLALVAGLADNPEDGAIVRFGLDRPEQGSLPRVELGLGREVLPKVDTMISPRAGLAAGWFHTVRSQNFLAFDGGFLACDWGPQSCSESESELVAPDLSSRMSISLIVPVVDISEFKLVDKLVKAVSIEDIQGWLSVSEGLDSRLGSIRMWERPSDAEVIDCILVVYLLNRHLYFLHTRLIVVRHGVALRAALRAQTYIEMIIARGGASSPPSNPPWRETETAHCFQRNG